MGVRTRTEAADEAGTPDKPSDWGKETVRARICILIRALTVGGAERQAVTLALGLAARGHRVTVVVMYPDGPLTRELTGSPVRVVSTGKKGRWEVFGFLPRLVATLRAEAPEYLLSYMNLVNVLAIAAKPFLPGTRVVWGLRSTDQTLSTPDWLSKQAIRLERRLSFLPDAIIANSRAGSNFALGMGFPPDRLAVVHNGVDVRALRPDRHKGRAFRLEAGIPEDAVVVGIIGRMSLVKDHPCFLEAAARFLALEPKAWFLIMGTGKPAYENEMKALAASLGLSGRVVWCGPRAEMLGPYNCLDVLASTSVTEGFSNVIVEAMACGVPVAATDVGDSAYIVGATGKVVKVSDPKAMCRAWADILLEETRERMEERVRIAHSFSVARLVRETERVLSNLGARAGQLPADGKVG